MESTRVNNNIFPSTFNSSSTKGKLHWLLITSTYLAFAWAVGNLIPFFSDVQGLLGALLGAPIAFMWPSLYYLLTSKKQNQNQDEKEATTGSSHTNSSTNDTPIIMRANL